MADTMPKKAPAGDAERQRAAEIAVGEVKTGMKLGLGSGRTAEYFVRFLGARVREGLRVVGVATSEQTARLAREVGVPLTTLDADPILDLTIDGADEIDPKLRLIKGGGGAMLREKIVAAASRRMIVVGDASKQVATLGAFPVPIEVIPFGAGAIRVAIERAISGLGLSAPLTLRQRPGGPYITDSGNHIFDASFGRIPDPDKLDGELKRIPGVVEHGLFIGLASSAIIAHGDCVEWLSP